MEDDAPIEPGQPEEPEGSQTPDFSRELDQLAVVEAELAEAEAELEALEAPANDPEPTKAP